MVVDIFVTPCSLVLVKFTSGAVEVLNLTGAAAAGVKVLKGETCFNIFSVGLYNFDHRWG